MRLFAHMVVRNEADRYLDACLRWHLPIFDAIHVFDDHSSDDTPVIATRLGCVVTESREAVTFLEHEGRFREAAWRAFERACDPQPGDWVLALDADEFLIANYDERTTLESACTFAGANHQQALYVQIPEVWQVDEQDGVLSDLRVRVDGWWGRIQGTRLFAYQHGGTWPDKAMGCGSEPTYVQKAHHGYVKDAVLMHFGYALPEDQKAKYQRYNTLAHGHSDRHIQSIIEPPTLQVWNGLAPVVRRGHP